MALTRPVKYDIKDSNIALLGSPVEKRVREHAGDGEGAWEGAGRIPGLQIWRIEHFTVVVWPAERTGSFYNGDSYIVLHTYKKDPGSEKLSFDLHFWLGEDTTQDEAGTAAYKTVELDDHLHGAPVQYREVQGFESTRFLSYFPKFVTMRGGVATGFHHVSAAPPLNLRRLYRITLTRSGTKSTLVVREVAPEGSSLIKGDVYVLDKGTQVWQLNTKTSAGQERFKAAEFVQSLLSERKGKCELTVYDEGGHGAGVFLSEFDLSSLPSEPQADKMSSDHALALFRLSDSTGTITFDSVAPSAATLSSDDAFLLDCSALQTSPAVYIWLGKTSSQVERRMAIQHGQQYLYNIKAEAGRAHVAVNLVKMSEGEESETFWQAFSAS